MRASLRLAPLVAAATMVAACATFDSAPVYTVDTQYQLPAAPEARSQALQCEQIKYGCLQLAETRMQQCMPPAQRTYEACMNDPMTAPFQCEDRLAAAQRACDETRTCEENYDSCFQGSGGTIERTSRCVRNCPAAP